ncbi:MAG: metal-dependent transcriptional regulator [Flavobacteriales bacterium]|nr:MAG: metal-dependent transcriptional regulator [Flavobacteriales bacterium]
MASNLSLTEENYLKTIFALSAEKKGAVNTSALAKQINIASSSVTDMLRKLSEKGYIAYEKYQGVTLSPTGRSAAINIIRKHRLWEVFLVEKLQFQWDEVHEIAEQLEHIRSTELTARLYEYLGKPQFDPHGDPIPDEDGNFPNVQRKKLSDFTPGETVRILGVNDDSPSFLQYLQQLGLALGTELFIESKIDHDQSMWVKLSDSNKLMLSNISCQNIFCKSL